MAGLRWVFGAQSFELRERDRMTENTKQAYMDKMNAQLNEWSAKMSVVKAKIDVASASARIDLHQQLEVWQEKEFQFKQKMEDVRASGVEGFETMKLAAQAVWDDVSSYMAGKERS